MSLEDAVLRLVNVIGTQTNEAVAEIIRQRDAAQQRCERLERDRKYYSTLLDEEVEAGRKLNQRITALRGVITRMKNNSGPGAGEES